MTPADLADLHHAGLRALEDATPLRRSDPPSELSAGIEQHGSFRQDGLLDPEFCEDLCRRIDAGLTALQNPGDHEPSPFAPFPIASPELTSLRLFTAATDSLLMIDVPELFEDIMNRFDQQGVLQEAARHLQDQPVLAAMKSVLRRVRRSSPADWHQDGAFLGRDVRSVNFWIALSPCGAVAPSLDVLPVRLPHLLETGGSDANFDWSIGSSEIAATGKPVETLSFSTGDSLAFDHLFAHRTAGSPDTSGTRYAIECWFFAASAFPEGEIPILPTSLELTKDAL